MKKNLVAVITVRKGSVRVKNKNFKSFAKKKFINTQNSNFKKSQGT